MMKDSKTIRKIKKSIVALILTISLLTLPVFAFNSSVNESVAEKYKQKELTQEQVVQWEDDLYQLHREVNLLNRERAHRK